MAPATFYTVKAPRGIYYAIRNHHTGKVWTERTEHAAERQAADEKLAIVASESIEHSQLLELMISQASVSQPAQAQESTPTPAKAVRLDPHNAHGLSRLFKLFHREHNDSVHAGGASR